MLLVDTFAGDKAAKDGRLTSIHGLYQDIRHSPHLLRPDPDPSQIHNKPIPLNPDVLVFMFADIVGGIQSDWPEVREIRD